MRGNSIFTRCLGAAIAVGAVGSAADGAVLLSDNFDSYANQAAFEAVWTPIGTASTPHTASGILSTTQASSPTKSVEAAANAVAGTSGPYRNRRSFTESGTVTATDQIVWSFDFYDTVPAGAPQRNFSNLQDTTAPSLTNQLISMGTNNTIAASGDGGNFFMARILGYSPPAVDPDGGPGNEDNASGNFFKLNDTGAGLRGTVAGWRNLKVVLSTDGANATDFKFYVDNILVETVNDVGTTLRSYDNIAIGSGLGNGNVAAFYDNMQLDFVPEPSSLALIALGGLALVRRRRA